MTAPLKDIRVLDFSTLLPGPMATLFLAEAGAEVIKIERPGRGEEMRDYDPKWGQDSANFAMLNRGKKSLALDLKDPDQRARLVPLLKEADIIVEQFRPGVMDRLGLSYEDIAAINPRIIYCSITGYGQSGPKAVRAGHDLNYIGDSGLLALSCGGPQAPVLPPALIADIAGGTYPAVFNILLALRDRDRTGKGAHLDISMSDNLFPFMYWALGEGQATGQWPGNGDALVTGGSPRYRLYPTSDGRFVAAAPIEQKFWQVFIDAIGLPADLYDDRRDPDATAQAVATRIAGEPADHWRAVFERADCCCTVVQTLQEALQDPHFQRRGLLDHEVENTDGVRQIALPVPVVGQFRAAPHAARAPALGADNDMAPEATTRHKGDME
ncbi:CaiB/BaiF CoA transferase family protein [Roseovarius amoyensis]|uniref:CaiB/BaiF CoA transferase family protein n=1 Tax=Roseovarius amoyensis TaxID=2211448 RepID=UPI000DBE9BED|nr:CaiB/BaiF CoA-transferase family protein [Roseovarius amoyensis]